MAFDYASARKTAEQLIKNFGAPGQVVKKGEQAGGFDDDGNISTGTPDVTIDGTVTPKIMYKSTELNGESIIQGDSWVYFHSTAEPEITINGIVHRIKSIKPITSVAGTNVFRKLQLRE